jgi:hypothetical protein
MLRLEIGSEVHRAQIIALHDSIAPTLIDLSTNLTANSGLSRKVRWFFVCPVFLGSGSTTQGPQAGHA